MTEQQPYQVIAHERGFELRHYPAYVVAEVTVAGEFDQAGSAGFGPLVGFIGGRNLASQKIAMTAPVLQAAQSQEAQSQNAEGQEIAMTAPVIQHANADGHTVQFVMPAGMSVEKMPMPADARVSVKQIPAHEAAAFRYSGRTTEKIFNRHARELLDHLTKSGYEVVGPVRSARFDPPWTPPFMRRNEVIVPVRKKTSAI